MESTRRKGFTLIELLIVTVVIATLMGLVFRLAGAGGDRRALAITVDRMQRLENALSGYQAAFGSYPPVPLQGRSRNVYKRADSSGIQEPGTSASGTRQMTDWWQVKDQVMAACKAQPVAALFPYNNVRDRNYVQAASRASSMGGGRSFSLLNNVGGLNLDSPDWGDVQVFQFGLMSFLLPRYSFMLDGESELYDRVKNGRRVGQWAANNRLPARLDTGERFKSWSEVQEYAGSGRAWNESGNYDPVKQALVENLATQSVCARWMPNLEGIVAGGYDFFGVNTAQKDNTLPSDVNSIFSRGGYNAGGSAYILCAMTVADGWNREFLYHSEPPYTSYKLWSAGANGQTFPPWYDLSAFSQTERDNIGLWIGDDISGMNH